MLDKPENPSGGSKSCNILADDLCQIINADPYTVVLTIWAALQLTWVTMLLFVQFVQVSRAMTTYESMRGQPHYGSKASEAISSALTAGTTSTGGAQLNPVGMGADPALHHGHGHGHGHHHKQGCWATWKKLLGFDTFVATA